MLGDQLAVQSFVTVMPQAAFSPDGLQFATGDTLDVQSLQTGIRWFRQMGHTTFL
jgi:hypothetical protein